MGFKVKAKISDKMCIVDAQHLSYRNFHMLNLTNLQGNAIGCVFGVINSLKKLRKKYPGYDVAFCWDTRPTVRKEMYSEYKAHRGEKPPWFAQFLWQVDQLRACLPMLGVDQYQSEGYEADDIAAELVRMFRERKFEEGKAVLVTSDKDWMQLVDRESNVEFYDPIKDKTYNEEAVCSEFGIQRAKSIAVVKSILGDSSDNVPSVKRFPKKLIAEITNTWSTPNAMYTNFALGSGNSHSIPDKWKQILIENREMVELNYKLVKLGHLRPEKIERQKGCEDIKALREFYQKHGFKSLLNEMAKEELVMRSVQSA